ncbi:MAG: hypothetical protein J5977_08155, partial [Fibrobacter sp.]|nr:hypothetical protein [Fibrobacter sp.]
LLLVTQRLKHLEYYICFCHFSISYTFYRIEYGKCQRKKQHFGGTKPYKTERKIRLIFLILIWAETGILVQSYVPRGEKMK